MVVKKGTDVSAETTLEEAYTDYGVVANSGGELDGLETEKAKAKVVEMLTAKNSGTPKVTRYLCI